MLNHFIYYALTSDEPVCRCWRWLERNTRYEWMADRPFVMTVFYRDPISNRVRREDFTAKEKARKRANELSRLGYRAWLRPYKPPKRPIDYIAERGRE